MPYEALIQRLRASEPIQDVMTDEPNDALNDATTDAITDAITDSDESNASNTSNASNASSTSDEAVGSLLRVRDVAPTFLEPSEPSESSKPPESTPDAVPARLGAHVFETAFWKQLTAEPTSDDVPPGPLKADSELTGLCNEDGIAFRVCCASTFAAESGRFCASVRAFRDRFRATGRTPTSIFATARIRAALRGNASGNVSRNGGNAQVREDGAYRLFLALLATRASVFATLPTADARMLFREAAAAHVLNQALQHAARRKRSETGERRANGFTRTHTLVLTHSRHYAWRFVSLLLGLCPGTAIRNLGAWEARYSPGAAGLPADAVPDAHEALLSDDRRHTGRWRRLFCGDTDDVFYMGFQVVAHAGVEKEEKADEEKADINDINDNDKDESDNASADKTAFASAMGFTIVLETPPRVSDVIVASPLGLRQLCNIDPTTERTFEAHLAGARKIVNDVGLLSSIHTLYIDNTEALEMQNWEHLASCVWALNRLPQDAGFHRSEAYAADIRSYLPPYVALRQHRVCQIIANGDSFGELLNGLLRAETTQTQTGNSVGEPVPKRRLEETIVRYRSRYERHMNIPLSEAFRGLSLLRNGFGSIRLLGVPTLFGSERFDAGFENDGLTVRHILHRHEAGRLLERRTALIDPERLGFRVEDHPKLDYLVNRALPKLLGDVTVDKRLLIILPDAFCLARLERVLRLVDYDYNHNRNASKKYLFLRDEDDHKESLRAARKLANGTVNCVVVTERTIFYRQPPFRHLRTVLFFAPPTSGDLLADSRRYFGGNEENRSLIVLYAREEDLVRLGNNYPPSICANSLNHQTLFLGTQSQ